MIYFLALLPATALTIAGYFVLYLSSRTDGTLRTFGKYLGFWAFTLAGLVVLGGIFAAAHGGHRGFMRGMRERHCPWEGGARMDLDRDRRAPGEEGRRPPPPAGTPNPPDSAAAPATH